MTLSLERLASLPQVEIVTETEFTDGRPVFRGPLLRDLVRWAGLEGADELRLVALNGYETTMPASDYETFDVVLALQMNGEALSPRNKGPIWIIYPLDDDPRLSAPIYKSRMIWQLVKISTL